MKRMFDLDSARGFVPTLIGRGYHELSEPDEVISEIIGTALT